MRVGRGRAERLDLDGVHPGDVGVMEVGTRPATYLEVNKVDAETLTAYEIGSKNRFLATACS